MDANKAFLWIAGAVFVVAMVAGNMPGPSAPVDNPTKLEADLLAAFYPKGANPEKARTDLMMFAGLNYGVANAVETCDEATGLPELKTGAQVARFRKMLRMMIVGNESFVKQNAGLGDVIKTHFDATLGTDAGEITQANRPKWKTSHLELGQASARACYRIK